MQTEADTQFPPTLGHDRKISSRQVVAVMSVSICPCRMWTSKLVRYCGSTRMIFFLGLVRLGL